MKIETQAELYDVRRMTGTVCALLGVPCHEDAAPANDAVLARAAAAFGTPRCDRVFLYNPDAIALWVYLAHRELFSPIKALAPLYLPVKTVYPPVTPVCFASMYTGLLPEQHGIQRYTKPVLKVDTLFDDLCRAQRRVAIVSTAGDSISRIFLQRKLDYYICKTKEECNEKAMALIKADHHELIVLYNGDYDHWMHRFGPEGRRSLRALSENVETFCALYEAIQAAWGKHNTALAFAPDHGCHRVLGFFGTHGKDAPCDRETVHFWTMLPKRE